MQGINSSLAATDKSLKSTGAELGKINKQLKFDPTNTVLLAQKQDILQKHLQTSRERVDQLTQMLEAHNKKMRDADTVTEEMEAEQRALAREVEKAKGQVSYYAEELDKLSKKPSVLEKLHAPFDKLKESVQKAKDEHPKLAAAIEKAGEAGKKVASGGMAVLKGAFAGAAAAAGAIVAGTAAVVKGLLNVAGSAAEAGDAIDKGSQKIGISAEDYQILSFEAERSGTSIQTISKAAAKLKSAGSDLDVKEAIAKIAAIQDPAERSAAAVEMFGAKTAQELAPMLNAGTEGLAEMEKAARDCGMVMSNDAVAASAKYEDSLTNLKTTFSAIKNNAMSELLPGMTSVLDGLTAALSGEDGAEKLIEGGIDNMMNALDTMIPRFGSIFDRVATVALEAAPKIIVSIADGLISRLDEITATAFTILTTLTEGLLTEDNLRTIMEAAVGVITNLVGFLADNVDLLIDSAFLCVTSLADALLADDNVEKLIQAALDIILSLAIGLIDHLPELIDACFRIVEAVVEALLSYDWTDPGKQILLGLIDGLGKVLSSLLRTIKNIGKAMIDAIKDVLGIHSPSTVFAGLGKNLLEGLWNGIQDVKDWLVGKIRGLGSTITDALKSVFGISSPSKVFENEIGKNLGLGIGVGFEKAMDDVKQDMEDAIPTDFDLPEPEFPNPRPFGFGGGGAIPYMTQTLSAGYAGAPTINLSLNIGEFHNNRQEDINHLADEISEVLAAKLQRKQGAFA